MNPTQEQWLPVVGFEDLYQVSNFGQVRSNDRHSKDVLGRSRLHPGRLLKASLTRAGYARVSLCRDGKKTTRFIHHLVLEAFRGPCPEGRQTCHGNDVPTDNRLENLRWGTPSDNQHDKVRNGGHHYATRDACSRGHEYTPENIYFAPGRPTCRQCRQCRREDRRERYLADKTASL